MSISQSSESLNISQTILMTEEDKINEKYISHKKIEKSKNTKRLRSVSKTDSPINLIGLNKTDKSSKSKKRKKHSNSVLDIDIDIDINQKKRIKKKCNIIIFGSKESGKTSFLNKISNNKDRSQSHIYSSFFNNDTDNECNTIIKNNCSAYCVEHTSIDRNIKNSVSYNILDIDKIYTSTKSNVDHKLENITEVLEKSSDVFSKDSIQKCFNYLCEKTDIVMLFDDIYNKDKKYKELCENIKNLVVIKPNIKIYVMLNKLDKINRYNDKKMECEIIKKNTENLIEKLIEYIKPNDIVNPLIRIMYVSVKSNISLTGWRHKGDFSDIFGMIFDKPDENIFMKYDDNIYVEKNIFMKKTQFEVLQDEHLELSNFREPSINGSINSTINNTINREINVNKKYILNQSDVKKLDKSIECNSVRDINDNIYVLSASSIVEHKLLKFIDGVLLEILKKCEQRHIIIVNVDIPIHPDLDPKNVLYKKLNLELYSNELITKFTILGYECVYDINKKFMTILW